MIRLWADILNRGAQINSEEKLHDFLKVGIPAIVTTLSGAASLAKLFLAAYPAVNVIIDGLMSMTGLAVACYVVSAKIRAPGLIDSEVRQYRYNQLLRRFAKFGLFPLFLVAVYGLWRTLPVGITGPKRISGFLCSARSGGPIGNASVVVLSQQGTTISQPTFGTDTVGYFVIYLKWWGTRPETLAIQIPGSQPLSKRIDDNVSSEGGGCRATVSSVADTKHLPAWYLPN